jgi:hypothetical protein
MSFEKPSFNSENAKNPEKVFARKKDELPPLKEGYVRIVHITNKEAVEKIIETGLNYSGVLSSTSRAWFNEKDVEFSSDDLRFKGPDKVAVVIDMPMVEHRRHENLTKSPELVPSDYIVGVIPSVEE